MGTSGAYKGSGGKAGKAIRREIKRILDNPPPPKPPRDTPKKRPPDQPLPPDSPPPPIEPVRLDPAALLPIISLIRPRHSGGGGGGGPGGGGGGGGRRESMRSGGGPRRSAAASASSAGRAAAGAYAYRTGDAVTLERLGLNYDELRALDDDFEVLRRIVDMACGTSDGTIEQHEQGLVAADVAEMVLSEPGSAPPAPEDIVRHAIASIIAQAVLSEAGQLINGSDRAAMAETEVRDAAEALAGRATLSATGATESEIATAIEKGIEALRSIYGGSD